MSRNRSCSHCLNPRLFCFNNVQGRKLLHLLRATRLFVRVPTRSTHNSTVPGVFRPCSGHDAHPTELLNSQLIDLGRSSALLNVTQIRSPSSIYICNWEPKPSKLLPESVYSCCEWIEFIFMNSS